MKGLGITAKTASILFLLAVIFISLALSGYTFLVSNHPSTPPPFVTEGLENAKKETVTKDPKKEEVKGDPVPSTSASSVAPVIH
jgi:hypothetical protein